MKKVLLAAFIVIVLFSCSRNTSAQQETLSIGDMINSASSLFGKTVPSGYYADGSGDYYSVDPNDLEMDKPFLVVTPGRGLIETSGVMYLSESYVKANSWLIEGIEYLEANGWVYEPLYSDSDARWYSKGGITVLCATEDMDGMVSGMIMFTAW